MRGIAIAGQDQLPEFKDHIFHSHTRYLQDASQSSQVLFFNGRSAGPGLTELEFGAKRYRPQVGEWVLIPIWVEERYSGVLAMDNAEREIKLSETQKSGLGIFARMISLTLGRVRLFGLEKYRRQEIELLNRIERQITLYTDDLGKLLKEISAQIKGNLDVSNFIIALVNEDEQKIDIRLHYDNGKLLPRHFLPIGQGLTGYIVREKIRDTLYFPEGSEEFIHEKGIHPRGKPDKCWVGIPLWVGEKMVGVMIVQDYTQPHAYRRDDVHLLEIVADQVAGAISAALKIEKDHSQLEMLQLASVDLMKLATQSEEWMWETLLHILSANYGLRFNRASLFLASKDNQRLIGRAGIGHIDPRLARRDWEQDLKNHMNYDKFLQQLYSSQLRPTPVDLLVRKLSFERGAEDAGDVLFQVLEQGKRIRLSASAAARRLPQSFVREIQPGDCAVVPIRAGDRSVGLVVIDNKHDGKLIQEEQLDHLETILNLSSLAWESLCRRREQAALLSATRAVSGQSGRGSLKDRLAQICQSTRVILGADWVVIFPFRLAGRSHEYDTSNIGSDGNLTYPEKQVKDKPRQFGFSAHILRTGRVVAEDVLAYNPPIDGVQLADHPFILREKFRAFIGLPLTDLETAANLGVMYLDFTYVQKFSKEDLDMADTLAGLAANTILNWHTEQKADRGLEETNLKSPVAQRELEIWQKVLKASLSGVEPLNVIKALINAVPTLLNRTDLQAWVAREEMRPKSNGGLQQVLCYYAIQNDNVVEVKPPDDLDSAHIQHALSTGHPYSNTNNHDMLTPIKYGERCLGLLLVRSLAEPFTPGQKSGLVRLALQAYLALDNVQRQVHLHSVLEAAKAVTAPIELDVTLQAIVDAAVNTFPGLSSLTIWYTSPYNGRITLGPSYGVKKRREMESEIPLEGTIVWKVMHSRHPIFTEDSKQHEILARRFVFDEDVQSTAALSLRSDGKPIGAIFFNYSALHPFTAEEKALFEVLAEIVASSLRNAYQLEREKQEKNRVAAMVDVAEAISTTLDLNEIVRVILQKLQKHMAAKKVMPCLLIYDADEKHLDFAPPSREFYTVDHPEYLLRSFLRLEEHVLACEIARQTLQEGSSLTRIVEDRSQLSGQQLLVRSTQSVLYISMVNKGRLVGILMLESPLPSAFEETEAQMAQGIAREIGLAIERSQYLSELRYKERVTQVTAWAADLAHDIGDTVGWIRNRAMWIQEHSGEAESVRLWGSEIVALARPLEGFSRGGEKSGKKRIPLEEEIQTQVKELLEKAPQVQFHFERGCGDLVVRVNPLALERVLRHLVNNAIDVMDRQGTLTIRTHRLAGREFEIQVQDSGPGVNKSIQHLILQEPVSTKGKKRGYGLLLARQAVEGMGGRIRFLGSKPGQGAVFSVRLPIGNLSPRKKGKHAKKSG